MPSLLANLRVVQGVVQDQLAALRQALQRPRARAVLQVEVEVLRVVQLGVVLLEGPQVVLLGELQVVRLEERQVVPLEAQPVVPLEAQQVVLRRVVLRLELLPAQQER